MVYATAIRDGEEFEIHENGTCGRPMDRVTFHREPTKEEVYAIWPCLIAKDGQWRIKDGPWHHVSEIGKLVK